MLTPSVVDNFQKTKGTRSILHCNIRSVAKNSDVLCSLLTQHSSMYDVIALTETWLRPGESYNIPNYLFISHPREANNRGGGVGIYIRKPLAYTKCSYLPAATSCESLFVEIDNVVYGVVYRPPQSHRKLFLKDLESIFSYLNDNHKNTVVVGDVNIDILGGICDDYQNLLNSYGFQNLISYPTRITSDTCTCLDHVLCNFKPVSFLSGPYDIPVADHLPIALLYRLDSNRITGDNFHGYTTQLDYDRVSQLLSAANFEDLNGMDASEHCRTLVERIKSVIKDSSKTVKKTYHTHPICPWMTANVLNAIKTRDFWYTKMKQNRGNSYYSNQFRIYRNKAVAAMRKQKRLHYKKQVISTAKNHGNLWKVINTIIRPTPSKRVLPEMPQMQNLADQFNEHFCSVGSNLHSGLTTPKELCLPPWHGPSFGYIDITETELISTAKNLNSMKAKGIDGIPISVLTKNIEILAPTLVLLFNKAFHTGIYPEILKIAKVTPIYKTGNQNELSNYRPISVLSCINTLFEKLLAIRVKNFLHKNSILSPDQHGFQKNKSTLSAVLSVTDVINEALNNNRFAIGVFLDIRKAFDTVHLDILSQKLERYGFRGQSLRFFKSYLNGRYQRVVIDEHVSSLRPVCTGVPQGSVLGPILFTLYINDLTNCLSKVSAVMYADDTALLFPTPSLNTAAHIINNELLKISEWFTTNRLTLNTDKTKYLIFRSPHKPVDCTMGKLKVNDKEIEKVGTISYLGVMLDDALHWKPHLQTLGKKLSSVCFTLTKARQHFETDILRTIYFSLFQSQITYCIECWGFTYHTSIKHIICLQKRALRIINHAPPRTPSRPLFSKTAIMPVLTLRDYRIALLVNKIICNNFPFPRTIFQTPSTSSRSASEGKFLIPLSHNTYGQRRLKYAGVKVWNDLPPSVLQSTRVDHALKEFFFASHNIHQIEEQ